MVHYSKDDLKSLPKLTRGALINGIAGVKPLNLIGTSSENGQYNLAIFNSVMHIGSNPSLLGFTLRPTTVDRHSYDNMLKTGAFSVNQVNIHICNQAHQTSAGYDRDISEFDAVGLTPEIISPHKSPFVRESKIKLACAYKNEYFIEENGCRLIIGEIVDIYAEEHIIDQNNGFVNLDKAESAGAIGLDGYVSIKLLDRLAYARPGQATKSILKDGTP